jgi:hypothetical protein
MDSPSGGTLIAIIVTLIVESFVRAPLARTLFPRPRIARRFPLP